MPVKKYTIPLEYGKGECIGKVGFDSVKLGEDSASVGVPKQMFLRVSSVSEPFSQAAFDGIIGMAFQAVAPPGLPPGHVPFVEQLASSMPAGEEPVGRIAKICDCEKDHVHMKRTGPSRST